MNHQSFVRKDAAHCVRYNKIFTIIEQFHKRGIPWVKYYVSAKSRDGMYLPEMGTYECPASQFRACAQPA